jgi:hypothetical protein
MEPLCKQFLRILEYTPILSPSIRAYDISLFLFTDELNKLYIKTHISKLQWKNIPPFATGKLK